MTAIEIQRATWVPVCSITQVPVDRGVAALLGAEQIALFRLSGEDGVHVIGNIDPFSGIGCLSRGLIGDVAGEPMVVSPLHKQRFSLRTGACLDAPSTSVARYEARVADGTVEVRLA